jgi:hypothetical protein
LFILGKSSTTELHPQPNLSLYKKKFTSIHTNSSCRHRLVYLTGIRVFSQQEESGGLPPGPDRDGHRWLLPGDFNLLRKTTLTGCAQTPAFFLLDVEGPIPLLNSVCGSATLPPFWSSTVCWTPLLSHMTKTVCSFSCYLSIVSLFHGLK